MGVLLERTLQLVLSVHLHKERGIWWRVGIYLDRTIDPTDRLERWEFLLLSAHIPSYWASARSHCILVVLADPLRELWVLAALLQCRRSERSVQDASIAQVQRQLQQLA
jgi:hypothetical protein